MPQLDPTPWFKILMLTWAIFLTLIPSKVLSHQTPNDLLSSTPHKVPTTTPWNWPW